MPRDSLAGADEAALLALYARGDPDAARGLALRLVPRALALAARLLADRAEAEDVVQEAMLRLWRAAPDWRPGEARVSTWLHRVVTNLAIDRARARRRRPLAAAPDLPEPAGAGGGGFDQMVRGQRRAALESALAALPDRQRQALVLRHWQGLSNPEIAQVLGVGIEAVESLTARAKRALTAALAGRREDLGYLNEIEE